jgi:hypothetical protein
MHYKEMLLLQMLFVAYLNTAQIQDNKGQLLLPHSIYKVSPDVVKLVYKEFQDAEKKAE